MEKSSKELDGFPDELSERTSEQFDELRDLNADISELEAWCRRGILP